MIIAGIITLFVAFLATAISVTVFLKFAVEEQQTLFSDQERQLMAALSVSTHTQQLNPKDVAFAKLDPVPRWEVVAADQIAIGVIASRQEYGATQIYFPASRRKASMAM